MYFKILMSLMMLMKKTFSPLEEGP